MQNQRLDLTGLAKPGETHGLTSTGPGLARLDAAGRVFGRFWNRTEQCFWFKPRPLAGYPDPLLTLGDGEEMESGKETKNGWLNTLFEVQQFTGFCNYYRRFIPQYSEQAQPVTRLTRKDEQFVWEAEQQLAFKAMVTAFTTSPVL